MDKGVEYAILILLVVMAVFAFYSLGQSTINGTEESVVDYNNLTNLPTSTPKPQIFKFIQEALKRHPRPTLPPEDNA